MKIQEAANTCSICPKCSSQGYVHQARRKYLYMQCSKCDFRWITVSMKCHSCGKANGFAVEGLCTECYKHQRLEQ